MFSKIVLDNLKRSSGIRAMFDEGEKLKKMFGTENVFDFTLGNPDSEPPQKVKDSIRRLACSEEPGMHRYMSNAGYADVRRKAADMVSCECGFPVEAGNVIMTCGAAGGLNVALKALLDPGDEVISFGPCFPEYAFYAENHDGKFILVPYDGKSFQPDAAALARIITPRTKALILNSPNNPTGAVYSIAHLRAIRDVIETRQKEFGTEIYILADEPYAKLVYDGVKVPDLFTVFDNVIKVTSFSKSLSLPGERIGYIAVSPKIRDAALLVDAMIFANRVLGYVNAPALFQRVIAENMNETVDTETYRLRRDALYGIITEAGFTCEKPQGAFYLFPKAPIADDVEFKNSALRHNLLVVPGSSFNGPGHFRLAYCVSMDTIERSAPVFKKLGMEYGLKK